MAASRASLLVLLLAMFGAKDGVAQQECVDQRTCRDCIRIANCQWCDDVDYKEDRCRLSFAESACANISNPIGDPLQETRPTNLDEVAVSPERVVLNQRVGSNDAQTFQVNVTALRNLPLDLYLLMDLSGSMTQDLDGVKTISSEIVNALSNITSNVRLGFGSFNDKPTRPFTSQGSINDLCFSNPPNPECPYAFRHQISLTEDADEFVARIDAVQVTVNVDGPENGLEGLAQVITCEYIIGWRDRGATGQDRGLNRFILFITDDAFHYSGEGRLAGILKPYNGRCLVDSSAIVNGSVDYTQWDVYDYPSVGQIAALLDEFNVVPIFAAVVQEGSNIDVLGTYQNLADVIRLSHRANVAQLQRGSADILDVLRQEVEAILQTIALSPSPDDSLDISFDISATCPPGATLVDGMACDGVQLEQMVSFEVTVTLNSCYDQNTGELLVFPISLRVDVSGFGELNLTINGNCDCDYDDNNATERQTVWQIFSGDEKTCDCSNFSCAIGATTGQICNLNNMDTQEPIVRVSPASDVDLFGFAVVLHQLAPLESSDDFLTALGKTRIIIGAPKGTYPGGLPLDDPGAPRSNETGLVYMCPVEPGECEGVRGNLSLYSSDLSNDRDNPEGRLFDHFPIANLPRGVGLSETEFEIKTGQLLGMTLFSNGDTFIACAPRWTFRPESPQPRGRCYQSDRTLQGFTLLYPCSVRSGGSTGSTNGNGYCLTGTGVTAVDDSGTMTFVLGSPGYNNGRGVLYYHKEGNTVDDDPVFDQGQEKELDSNGVLTDLLAVYQGYQVINGYITNSRTSGQNPDILASVPRYNASTYSGMINLYNVDDPDTILSVSASGQQMGEFFGYSLVAADLTGDGYDEVIVGAPMYSDIETRRVEKGRVFVFENLGGTLSDEPVILLGEVVNGRFGSSLTNLGDVDNDGYEDLVVGAPYACSNPVPNCDNQNTGTVFIYYGRADLQTFGDQIPYVIQSGDIVGAVAGLNELFTFGFSLSSGVDVDNNQYNDLVVGAFESKVAIVIRSLPVADVNINLPAVDPLDLEESAQCMFNGEVFPCFDLKIEAIYSGRGLSGPLDVNFTLSEIVISGERRIFFGGDDPESFSGALTFVDNDNQTVKTVRIYTMNPATIKDILNPLMVEISTEEIQRPMAPADYDGNQTLNDLSPYPRLRVIGTLDQMIELLIACGDDNICDSNLMLEVGEITYWNTEASGNLTEVNEFLVGVVDTVDIEIIYRNIGPENAVGTTLTFTPTGVANDIITGAKIADLNNVCEVDFASTYTCSLESPITAPEETKTNVLRLTVDDDAMLSALVDGGGNFPVTFSVSVLNSPSSRENDTTNNDDMATFDLIGRADIYTTLDFNPITARHGGSGVVDVTTVNDLGVDVRLNIAVGNNGPIPADNVQLVLYFPSMAGDGSGFYLYPASLTTLTQNSVVNCSMTSFDPEDLVPIEGNRRRRSTMSPAMRRKRKAAIAGFKRVPRDKGGRADTMLDCSATMDACQQITCNITDLGVGMRGETQLSLISHVDERFYNGKNDTFALTAFSFVDLSQTGYLQMSNNNATATLTILPPLEDSSVTPSSILESSVTPSSTLESLVTPNSTLESSVTPSSTLESLVTPSSTLESSVTPSSTLESLVTPNSTLESSVTPSSTLESLVTPNSTLESSVTPSSTLESLVTPSSTLESSVTPSSTLESLVTPSSTLESSVTPSSTLEESSDTQSFLIHAVIWPIVFVLLLFVVITIIAIVLYFHCFRRGKEGKSNFEMSQKGAEKDADT